MTAILRAGFAGAMLFLAGCAATYKPVPDGYTGPIAAIKDTAEDESSSKARLFYVESIDGNEIENASVATRRNSTNTGFRVFTRIVIRDIPIRPMKLKIVGTHVTGAPIHEIAARVAGTFFSVEGVLDFTPKEGVLYGVRGELKKDASRIWIENATTNEIVSEVISANK